MLLLWPAKISGTVIITWLYRFLSIKSHLLDAFALAFHLRDKGSESQWNVRDQYSEEILGKIWCLKSQINYALKKAAKSILYAAELKSSENDKQIKKLSSPLNVYNQRSWFWRQSVFQFIWFKSWNNSDLGKTTIALREHKWETFLRTQLLERKGNCLALILPIKNLVRAWLA